MSPSLGLRIALYKVGQKRKVSQLLEARGVVRHDIDRARDVGHQVTVSMLALMKAPVVAQVRGDTVRGDSPLCAPRDSRGVVRHVLDRGVGAIMSGALKGDLGEQTGLFQVTVRDRTVRIVGGHYSVLDVLGECMSPHEGLALMVEVHSTHPHFGSIRRTQERRSLRHDLCQVCGPIAQTSRQCREGINVGTEVLVDPDPIPLSLGESQLEDAEETSRSRDGHRNESELPKHLLPLLGAHPLGGGEFFKDGSKSL